VRVGFVITQVQVVPLVGSNDEPRVIQERLRDHLQVRDAYFTGPNSLILAFVSASRGVEAKTQTPPSRSLMAVERPPKGITPNLLNGLQSGTNGESKRFLIPNRVQKIGHGLLGEDPDALRDLSDNCFAHGRALWFAGCTKVSGVQMEAFLC